jgi:hypothetical protein
MLCATRKVMGRPSCTTLAGATRRRSDSSLACAFVQRCALLACREGAYACGVAPLGESEGESVDEATMVDIIPYGASVFWQARDAFLSGELALVQSETT